MLGSLCWFYSRAARSREAQQAMGQLQERGKQRYLPPVWLAWAYDGLGATEQARASIQRAIEECDPALVHFRSWFKWWPDLLVDCRDLLDKAGL